MGGTICGIFELVGIFKSRRLEFYPEDKMDDQSVLEVRCCNDQDSDKV